MKYAGKKTKEWSEARKNLKTEYFLNGITKCEYPNCDTPEWGLSFHHTDKRSSGRAEHTFEATRLLCIRHHELCEYNKDENKKVILVRK